MNTILFKIFKKRLGIGAFFLSGVGFVIGMSLVLLSVQLYLSMFDSLSNQMGKDKYLILNKDINIANTIFNSKSVFSDDELVELKKQSFVKDIGLFTPNHYQVKAFAGGEMAFMTDLFFEAVPTKFIDNVPYDFDWSTNDDFLPIIVSDDFLNLYNYGYALSAGLPQVSRSTISLIPIKIEIKGENGKNRVFTAKVVAFSERIATVLVPQVFMDWANMEFADAKNVDVSRVIIDLNTAKSNEAQLYIKEKNYLINSEKMASARMESIAQLVMDVLVSIGGLFIIFSFVIILLNFSLIVSEAKPDIVLLLQVGYKPIHIVKHLFRYLFSFIFSISMISYAVFFIAYYFASNFLNDKGISVTFSFNGLILLILFAIIFLMTIAGAVSIYKKVVK